VTSGTITIDGQDISKVTLQSLAQAVGVVQQDAFLFTTSIENTLLMAILGARDPHRAGSEFAQLHNYIIGLPPAIPRSSANAAPRFPVASGSA